jgi:hypothetical protein
MSETQADSTTPTLEVRILRDGVVIQRELCETDEEANAVVEAWSDTEGILVEVEDLSRSGGAAGVLDPRPWEVDAEDLVYEDVLPPDEEEER